MRYFLCPDVELAYISEKKLSMHPCGQADVVAGRVPA